MNVVERPYLKGCHSTKNIVSLVHSEQKGKMFSKNKKSQLQLVTLSKTVSRANICLSHGEGIHHSSQHNSNSKGLRKEASSKNLKLTSSISTEFPQLLTKSASQTTMHRKMDENKIKLL